MPPETGRTLLLQFAKTPVEGQVKSRMVPHLSPQQALELHCDLVRWTSRCLVESGLGPVRLAVAGDAGHPLFEACQALGVASVVNQSGGGLGERMYRGLEQGLQEFDAVVLVGSDCPALDRDYLVAAVKALDSVSVVLGPAADGGYVLIGATQISPNVFRDVDWGTAQVYRQTVERLKEEGISWSSIPERRDIDRPEDLPYWRAIGGLGSTG